MKNITLLFLAFITLLGCQPVKEEKNQLNGIWIKTITIDKAGEYHLASNDLIDIENGIAVKVNFNTFSGALEPLYTDTLVLKEKDSLISLLTSNSLKDLKADTNRPDSPFEGLYKYKLNNDSLTIITKYQTYIYFRLKEEWKSNNEFKFTGEYTLKSSEQDLKIEFIDDSTYYILSNWVEKYPFRKYKTEDYKGYKLHCPLNFDAIQIITGNNSNPVWISQNRNGFFHSKLVKVLPVKGKPSISGKWIATERKTYTQIVNSDSLVQIETKTDIPMPTPPPNHKMVELNDSDFTITFKTDSALINRYGRIGTQAWKFSSNQKRILFNFDNHLKGRIWEIKEQSDSIMKVQMNSFNSFPPSQDIYILKKLRN